MVQTANKNLKLMSEYKKKISKQEIEKLILFGSRAKGDFNPDSDFDLIVVSKRFKDVKWHKRPYKLYLSWDYDYPVDFLCYTPEEFETMKMRLGIIQNAVKEGIEIK